MWKIKHPCLLWFYFDSINNFIILFARIRTVVAGVEQRLKVTRMRSSISYFILAIIKDWVYSNDLEISYLWSLMRTLILMAACLKVRRGALLVFWCQVACLVKVVSSQERTSLETIGIRDSSSPPIPSPSLHLPLFSPFLPPSSESYESSSSLNSLSLSRISLLHFERNRKIIYWK